MLAAGGRAKASVDVSLRRVIFLAVHHPLGAFPGTPPTE